MLGLKPLGKDYITVAVEDNNENIVFPYYDSGMGALIIRIKGVPDEVVRVRENYSRELTEKKLHEPVGDTAEGRCRCHWQTERPRHPEQNPRPDPVIMISGCLALHLIKEHTTFNQSQDVLRYPLQRNQRLPGKRRL